MLSDRLILALERGLAALPASGTIAVVEPPADADLSALPRDRVEVIARHFPAHRRFAGEGYTMRETPGGPYALAVFCLPRAKDAARDLYARTAAATEGPVVVDGQKTDGIDSMLKDLRARAEVSEAISKAHGKIFAVSGGAFDDWLEIPHEVVGGFATRPGVFSADGPDPASEALAAALPDLKGAVVDLGAGWGFLSRAILSHPGVTRLDLVEADHAALDAARENVTDPRAQFHWADARDWQPEAPADHVVTNPPFHTSRRADPELGRAFIRAAERMLKPHGTLWLVANRHLPYEKTLDEAFREVRALDPSGPFKLFAATRPRSPRKG